MAEPAYRTKCCWFETCSAPLCPMDRGSLEYGQWFPDEEVCQRRFSGDAFRWLRQQRKLKALEADMDPDRCFTFGMLVKLTRAMASVKGLSPDTADFPGAERAWLAQRVGASGLKGKGASSDHMKAMRRIQAEGRKTEPEASPNDGSAPGMAPASCQGCAHGLPGQTTDQEDSEAIA
jgi:hypothetical protein